MLPAVLAILFVFFTIFLSTNRRYRWIYILYNTLPRDLLMVYRFIKLHMVLFWWSKEEATIPKVFLKLVKKHPNKVAFYFEDEKWTFRQIEEFSNKVANVFKSRGYRKGDTVALLLENRPEYVGLWLGLSKIGVVAALINTNLVSDPLEHSLSVANCKALIYGANFANTIGALSDKIKKIDFYHFGETEQPATKTSTDLQEDLKDAKATFDLDYENSKHRDYLIYIYTSGTTGLPKAANISHVRYMFSCAAFYVMTAVRKDDVFYNPLPLYHSAGGMVAVGQTLLFGIPNVLRKKFSATNYWIECQKYNCTISNYIGEICRYLLSAHDPSKPVPKHKIRQMAGNGLRPQIWRKFQDTFGVKQMYEFYGATEGNTNLVNITNQIGAVGFFPRFATKWYPICLIKCDELTGVPIRNEQGFCTKCEIGEPGILIGKLNLKKQHVTSEFTGYVDKKESEKKILKDVFVKNDMYFNSGDLLVQDELGYFYFKDRTGDTFRWKGENVSTNEVESVISSIADLHDAIVYGVQVIIHNPYRKNTAAAAAGKIVWSESSKEIAILNINQTITALVAGKLTPGEERDLLFVGTTTNFLIYDVHDNKDVLFKECEDGLKSMLLALSPDEQAFNIIVGGNSSVRGFNSQGDEIFWIAIGDSVTSMISMDYDKDGKDELLISTEDFKICVYKENQIIAKHTETEEVTGLVVLPENRFAYSVSNGTIGVYERETRLWRVKSKNFPICMLPYNLLSLSSPQLISGWSNGKIDCRSILEGEVLLKDLMKSSVAGIVEGDYRFLGKNDIICVSIDGEVRGYCTTRSASWDAEMQQETIKDLLSQKQALLMELKHYERNTKFNNNPEMETDSFEASGSIPANTRLQIAVVANKDMEEPGVELDIMTNNSTIIKALIIFAEGIFKGESQVVHPPNSKLSSAISVPLYLPKDSPVDIHINALVGYSNSIQYHVFELTKQLPKFSMYYLKPNFDHSITEEWVEFKIQERLQRICIWVNQNFLLTTEIEYSSGTNLELCFKCLRDNSNLKMIFKTSGLVRIFTSNMAQAADLVQSLATYLNLESLESKANFPNKEENLKTLMQKLSDIQETRLKLGSDVADKLSHIRSLIIQAEDSKVNDIEDMLSCYYDLNLVNKEVIAGYRVKVLNYTEGLETMKQINTIIQNASSLRVGRNSVTMINHCRNAIKNNNIEGLIKIIRTGE